MNRILQLLMAVAVASLAGCMSYTPTGPLGAPLAKAPVTLPMGAQVVDVAVDAPRLNDTRRALVSQQLTDQVSRYVAQTDYFNQVITFPTKAGDKDVVLKFDFTSLYGHRAMHAGYLPGALLTLTIWIWVDGPIYVDTFDLAGSLTIEDTHGKVLAKTEQQVNLKRNVGLYDREYWAMTRGAPQLRELVAKLLADGTAKLPKQELAAHE